MGHREMTPNKLLRSFPRKVGLRINWGDEWCVLRGRSERILRGARFGAAKDGPENGNEEFSALLSKRVAQSSIGDAGWDALHGILLQ
jgi:hypothetical protein